MTLVPRNRLIFWTAAVFLPFSALAVVLPAFVPLAVGVMALLLVTALTDAFVSRNCLEALTVELPPLVRMTKNRDGDIPIRMAHGRYPPAQVRIGLVLPPELCAPVRDRQVRPANGVTTTTVHWPCRARRLGLFTPHACYLESESRLGFWSIRARRSVHGEIRVYPNLMTETTDLAALFRRQKLGVHRQRQIGKGKEFEQLREYLPGDSFEDIHWKATAKRRRPISKVFQIERTQEIYVILDASRLSARRPGRLTDAPDLERRKSAKPGARTPQATILERFITAALIMGMAAERQGDLFGLLAFSDQVKRFTKAAAGKAHFNACRDLLFTLEPETVSPDFDELFTFICSRIRRRSLLLFLTSLDESALAESFTRHLDLVTRRHLVLVNMLKPAGADPLFSSPYVNATDDLYKRLGGHLQWAGLYDTEKRLRRHGAELSVLDNTALCARIVAQYLNVKQRQIL